MVRGSKEDAAGEGIGINRNILYFLAFRVLPVQYYIKKFQDEIWNAGIQQLFEFNIDR